VLTADLHIAGATDEYLRATMTQCEAILCRHLFAIFPDNRQEPGSSRPADFRASLHRLLSTRETDTMVVQKYDVRRGDGEFEELLWQRKQARPVCTSARGTTR
jgi:hypothetical protein